MLLHSYGRDSFVFEEKAAKVKYISLVNLIAGCEIVRELVANGMTVGNVRAELERITLDEASRAGMLEGYEELAGVLGGVGASARAAQEITACLQKRMEAR